MKESDELDQIAKLLERARANARSWESQIKDAETSAAHHAKSIAYWQDRCLAGEYLSIRLAFGALFGGLIVGVAIGFGILHFYH